MPQCTQNAQPPIKVKPINNSHSCRANTQDRILSVTTPAKFSSADLAENWRSRLAFDCPQQSPIARESIVCWLLGEDLERFSTFNSNEIKLAQQAMNYRYRLLKQRYLGKSSQISYCHLITRLGSIALLQNKIYAWVAQSRDRQRAVVDVLKELLQELIQKDRYILQQTVWIAKCTEQLQLRNTLLFATLEEYCLRPVRNQPLLVYRFINYLKQVQRGGVTHIPSSDSIRLVSEQVLLKETDDSIGLLDCEAITQYQNAQALEEQQMLRYEVKQELESYLTAKVGVVAVQWLELYLQGKTQEAIAKSLNIEIKQVYRLREKISYHAVHGLMQRYQSKSVNNWLGCKIKIRSFSN